MKSRAWEIAAIACWTVGLAAFLSVGIRLSNLELIVIGVLFIPFGLWALRISRKFEGPLSLFVMSVGVMCFGAAGVFGVMGASDGVEELLCVLGLAIVSFGAVLARYPEWRTLLKMLGL